MKTDKLILAAILVLIGLVCLLLFVSLDRGKQVSQAVESVRQIQNYKPEPLDYKKIEELIMKSVVTHMATIPAPKDGRDGIDGKTPKNGVDGVNGANGKSTYELWLEQGNAGTIEDFLQSLKGEKGDPGLIPQIRLNLETGVFESKVPTDVFWQVIPKFCEVGC